MDTLQENTITFKYLEEEIFKYACEEALIILTNIMESIDDDLKKNRDKKTYRSKGKKKRTINTVMGSLEFKREIYKYNDEHGRTCYKYLLDEYLNFNTIGKTSQNMLEKVLMNITELSYRKTAQNIESSTNQHLSATTIHKLVDTVGEKLLEKEAYEANLYKKHKITSKNEAKVIFNEQDGVWIKLQGKDRKKKKSTEIKAGIAYDGWQKRNPKSDEYVTTNKVVWAGILPPKEFQKLSEVAIAKQFNIDEIEICIINGDGAKWIQNNIESDNTYFQLDQFHIAQAIIRNVRDKRKANKIRRYISKCEITKAMDLIIELLIENNTNEKEFKKLSDLFNYLALNRDSLVPYNLRADIQMPPPPVGKEYRTMGVMEHNIDINFVRRLKGQGKCWSIDGANKMSKLLAIKSNKGIIELVDNIVSFELKAEKLALLETEIKIKQCNKKVYTTLKGRIPFQECSLTLGRKAIKKILELKDFSKMSPSF